jgi:hypothetical protein
MEPDITSPKIIQRLGASLTAYFDFDNSPNCNQLRAWLSTFIKAVGQTFDANIITNAANRIDGKDFEDWKSIFIERGIVLQSRAICIFAHHVADVATLQISADRKVPCEAGYRYIDDFTDCWKRARRELFENYNIQPKSRKHQYKRAGRSWIPYPAGILEDEDD